MDLATLEEIRQVKYRYLRCIDLKLWDELAEVFTPDATVDYGTPAYGKPLKIAGRDEIVAFLRAKLGPDMITVHRAGQPEITVDGDTATGTWSFEDTVIATEHRIVIVGAAFYQDRYQRGADGRWRIAHTGYVRTYEAMMSLDDLPSFRLTARLGKPGLGRTQGPALLTQPFAEALAEAEKIIAGAPHVACEQDLAEGYDYLAGSIQGSLRLAWAYQRDFPYFVQSTGPYTKIGLDNPDTLYFHAYLRDDAEYVVSGRRGSTADLSFQVLKGDYSPVEVPDSLSAFDDRAIDIAADRSFELRFAPATSGRAWRNYFTLGAGSSMLLVREVYSDWSAERRGTISIRRQDRAGWAPPPADTPALAKRYAVAGKILLSRLRPPAGPRVPSSSRSCGRPARPWPGTGPPWPCCRTTGTTSVPSPGSGTCARPWPRSSGPG